MNDNECLNWCIVRYLHPANQRPARIRNIDEILSDELDFDKIKFPVKTKDIHKIERKNSTGISVFGYENKKKHPIYIYIYQKIVMKTNMWI